MQTPEQTDLLAHHGPSLPGQVTFSAWTSGEPVQRDYGMNELIFCIINPVCLRNMNCTLVEYPVILNCL